MIDKNDNFFFFYEFVRNFKNLVFTRVNVKNYLSTSLKAIVEITGAIQINQRAPLVELVDDNGLTK